MRTLTVVCPVYNEEEAIWAFYQELRRVLDTLTERWTSSVLFVVDRSTDQTLELLKGIAAGDPAVGLLVLSARFGQQASLLAGLDHCDADVVVMMDSDLQHPPAVIPDLLAAHEAGPDVVHTIREDTPDIPLFKRLSARLFYRLLAAISPTPIYEGAADFRLVSRRVVEVFQTRIRERTLFLRGLFVWVGFRSTTVRFRAGRRFAGRTKHSLGRMLAFALDGVVSFSRAPLHAALLAGFALVGLGLVGLVALLVIFVVDKAPPSDALVIAVLLSLFSGAQLVFTGIVGEYLGRVLDEVRGRPHYLVEERVNLPAAPVESGTDATHALREG